MPLKTNPIYAVIAYRKAILQEAISLVQRQFIGAGGAEPRDHIVCEDVFSIDSQVPVEEIQQFVHDLQAQKLQLELEMNEFDFGRKMNGHNQKHGNQQPNKPNTKSSPTQSTKGQPKTGQGQP